VLAACSGGSDAGSGTSGGEIGGITGTSGGSGSTGASGNPGTTNGGGSGGSTGFEECAGDRYGGEVGLRAANIVWVIDTSGSMDEEAAIVQQNLNAFVSSLAASGLVDYRVVVVSEPEFVSVPDPLGSDTKRFMYVEESVGSEEPLTDLLDQFDAYSNFLLKDVLTHFVVVTDDDSSIAASDFVSQMDAQLDGDFRVHAIASPPGAPTPPPTDDDDDDDDDEDGCTGPHGDAAAPGVEHYEAASLTDGLTFSICADDWSALFKQLASEVVNGAPLPCDLAIPEPKNGEALNPNLVNVILTPPGASQGAALPRTNDAASCGSAGWYYDDPAQPTRIVLCPASCNAAMAGGMLDIALGCESVVE
jgi:hypothetical protein